MYFVKLQSTCGINIIRKVNYSTLAIVLEELNHLFSVAIGSQLQELNQLFSEHAVELLVLN